MVTTHTKLKDEFPEFDLYPLNTPEAEDDLFTTAMDDEKEPADEDLAEVKVEEDETSLYVFKCIRCGDKHDMRNLRSDGDGSFICPRNRRVI